MDPASLRSDVHQGSLLHKALGLDSLSILFKHHSFQQPAVLPGFIEIFWKEGSLERMEMEGTLEKRPRSLQNDPTRPKSVLAGTPSPPTEGEDPAVESPHQKSAPGPERGVIDGGWGGWEGEGEGRIWGFFPRPKFRSQVIVRAL